MLNTFNLLCCSSSVDESRSISDKFLMSLYRSQGLCILVFISYWTRRWVTYLSLFFCPRFQFDFMEAEYLILFPTLYCLKNLQVRKEFKNVYMRLKTEDKTYGIQKPTQHFVRGIITLFTSLCLTHPLSLNETFHIHWFVLSRKHVPLSFATLSIFFFELQLQRNQKKRSTSAPPRLSAILLISASPTPHPLPPPLVDILNNRLFEEILFGKYSLFHLHSEYHNVILLPLVTSF